MRNGKWKMSNQIYQFSTSKPLANSHQPIAISDQSIIHNKAISY